MKVVFLNYSQGSGGAAVASTRLYRALKKEIKIDFLSIENSGSDSSRVYDKLLNIPFKKKGVLWSNGHFSSSLVDIDKLNKDYDLVHLHWINNGMLSINDISKIKIPIIWTFHDLWPLTGGCHVSGECNSYATDCLNCPMTKNRFAFDLAKYNKNLKNKLFKTLDISVTAPSYWLKEKILQAKVIPEKNIIVIPNGIDTQLFRANEKKTNSRFDILFGAISATSDANKGYDLLLDALKKVKIPKNEIRLNIFGDLNENIIEGIEVRNLGYVKNEEELVNLYRSVDVTCVPSRYESFGQVALESLLCGTPVVGFNSSGLNDIVSDKINGYLAKAFDTSDFALGIDNAYKKSYTQNRNELVTKFSIHTVKKHFLDLYAWKLKK